MTRNWQNYLITGVTFLGVWLLAAMLTGQANLGFDSYYNSFSLQAEAWLHGRLDLGRDYEWLELAIVDGRYYVSFPPFPSVVMLPLAAVFGANTPDTLVALLVALLGLYHAVALAEDCLPDAKHAPLWALYLLLGNGYLFLCMNGWVWFIAQSMCFTLSLAAIHHAVRGRGGWALAAWAASVGCRPMAVLLGPLLLWMLWQDLRGKNPQAKPGQLLRKRLHWAAAPTALAVFYMALNWARFGNPLEFGHNHLPEFQQYGAQFALSYIPQNLAQLFSLPALSQDGRLLLPSMDGGCAWLLNPMLWTALAAWIWGVKERRGGWTLWLLPVSIAAYLLVILSHRTLGAWQFGNRYLVDLMPWLYFGTLIHQGGKGIAFAKCTAPLAVVGIALHFFGTVAVYNMWM